MDSRRSSQSPAKPLRAIVEIIDGELKIYPISDSDFDEKLILDALPLSAKTLIDERPALHSKFHANSQRCIGKAHARLIQSRA